MLCRKKRPSDEFLGPLFQGQNDGEIKGMVSSSNVVLPFSLSILLLLIVAWLI